MFAFYLLNFCSMCIVYTSCSASSSNTWVDCRRDVWPALRLTENITVVTFVVSYMLFMFLNWYALRREFIMSDVGQETIRKAENLRNDTVPLIDDDNESKPLISSSTSSAHSSSHKNKKSKKNKKKKKKS